VALTRILLRASRESTNLDLNSLRRFSVTDNPPEPSGRLVALDLGAKRVGVAVSDELQIAVTPLPFIERRSWKDLLRRVAVIIEGYDARGLVIGLPLSLDGSDGEAAQEARRLAENFRRSLNVPCLLAGRAADNFCRRGKAEIGRRPAGRD
jgi:putative Holliday junction resolvase